jgi:hypothetical protein
MGPELAASAAEFLPSTVSGLLARTYGASGLVNRLPPLVNTVITNIPGVNVPLYSMGSKMVASYGLGPVYHGVGLFQPVFSYNNTITISAIADRNMMPDPACYIECLQCAYDELKAATIGKVLPVKKKKRVKKKAVKKAASGKAAPEKTVPQKSGNGSVQANT